MTRTDPARSARSRALPAAALAALTLALGGAPAGAATTLRWQQPAGSPSVSEFRIYTGPERGTGIRVFAGLPTPDAQGVYTATVTIDAIERGDAAYVWLTAANASGESPPSNDRFFPKRWDPSEDELPIPGAVDTGGTSGDGLLVPLRAVGAQPAALGHAELREGAATVFEVVVQSVPDGLYELFVDGAPRGVISVVAGRGALRFSSAPGAGEQLLDFAVKGRAVEVRAGGLTVLGRLFPIDVGSALGRFSPETRTFQFRVGLANTRVDLDATGDAEWRSSGGAETLRLNARDLPAGAYHLFVDGVLRASAAADSRGSLRLELGTTARPPQPLAFTVRRAWLEIRDSAGVAMLVGAIE